MNDTLPRAEALVRALLLRRSGEERLMMAADMFAASRALMAASLREEGLQPDSAEWKLRLLDRTYGAEISPAVRRRLIERWRSRAPQPSTDAPAK
jgi:hypothetical protein